MILEDIDLVRVIEQNPNKALVEFGQKQHSRARLHLYGKGIEQYVVPIEGFEKPFMQQLRLKYGMTNVDLFARQLKPKAKVYTARGTTSYYNLGTEGNQKAEQLAKSILPGTSVKKWVEDFWDPHSVDDPMGLIFVEIGKRGNAYPTYKCSTTVYDYQPKDGQGFEYIIFQIENVREKEKMGVDKQKKVYRVVDDRSDRLVVYDKDAESKGKVTDIQGESYINYFGEVPARWCGYVKNPDKEGGVVSILHYVFNLADTHLLESGIKITTMLKHGFQKYWEYGDTCIKCKGSGKFRASICPDCAGIGKQIVIKPGQDKIVEWPGKDSGGLVRGNPGGYIEPSKIAYDILTQELGILEDKISRTLWGSKSTQKLQPGMGLSGAPNGTVTATEVMDNRQPEADSIHKISDAAESIDKFIMDFAIAQNFSMRNYILQGGCSRNYGRRYLMEEPDALLDRYEKSRKEGVSAMILYGMYEAYLESKYQSDWVSLAFHRKMMKVEPLMHYTLAELKNGGASPEDIRMKTHYGDWLVTQENDFLLRSSIQQLLSSRDQFISSKPLPVEEVPAGGPT